MFGDGTAADLNSDFGFSTANISNYRAANTGPVLYNGASVANFSTEARLLASSGSTAGYGSLYQINLGSLAAGMVLTVTHGDGFDLFDNQTAHSTAFDMPTRQVTNTVVVSHGINGVLYYARENGVPSVLEVSVPEPMSLICSASPFAGAADSPPEPAEHSLAARSAAEVPSAPRVQAPTHG